MSKKINRIGIFILLFCIQSVVTRGQIIADSLSAILSQKNLPLEDRVMTMGMLARAKSLTQTENALKIGQQALQLSNTLSDPQYKTFIYSILVSVYQQHREMPKAQEALDSAIWYAAKTTNRRIKGIAWYRKAFLESLQGKSKESINSALEALKYLEGTGAYDYESFVYYNIAGTYAEWEDLPAERKYAELCVQAAEKSGNFDNMAHGQQAMATYYHYRYKQNRENAALLDSALYYNRNVISIYFAQQHRLISGNIMAVVALNVANLYQGYFPASYKDSVVHYLDIALKIGQETRQIAVVGSCYGVMSDYEMAAGNYERAEALLATGLSVLLSDSAKYTRTISAFMQSLSNISEKRGDYVNALRYYKEYYKTSQEVFDAEKMAISKRLEAQYQSEKNEAALKTLRQTAALNRKLNYLYISLAIAAIIALLFLFGSYHFRLKATRHQQQLMAKEKEDAELHARLKEEEAMRLMAEQQLLQERQERLQRDLLAGSLQVEQKDELLQAVQKKIEENKNGNNVLKQINQIIDQNKRIDETLTTYKADFDNIHPEFFEKLKEKSSDTLSRLDLKHCSYISIGLTNKEIAQRLGVAPKSILMARYRIKLKLGLGKDVDLDEYIGTLK
ncbi:regulatory protein, luxR family [Chitinophaga sp. YR573]|uniref:helix-turn-helix transcriptional regulator n=1 Tax=Chitinophaga sp. YR573 TaxID=1881040 RepID=UPI0008C370C2|nr:LuxR C-terminal-related transcriptional regulator [Chitinophaga sp. YR573]SEW34553.1 regulatory protein, luxR family [Chitinophaga sp. YR573]